MAKEFRTGGSSAYDVNFTSYRQNTALPLEQPQRLPDAPARRRPVKKVKARAAVSPFAVLGSAVAVVMLFLVVFSYVKLYEAKTDVSDHTREMAILMEEQEHLKARYEDQVNLEHVEQRARELGMRSPTPEQVIYVRVESPDTTEVYSAPTEKNFFVRIYDAFRSAFSDAVEYFS